MVSWNTASTNPKKIPRHVLVIVTLFFCCPLGSSFLPCTPLRKSTATALYAKEKKPRFTQTAHVGGESKKKFASQKGGITSSSAVSSSSSKQQKGGPKQGGGPKQVWDSGKSIDDLESTMLKRWGSLTDNPPPDMDEFEGEDDEEALDKGVVGLAGRRAVLDPWQQQEKEEASKKEKDKSKNPMAKKKKKVFEPEFYDQDDEGYEYIPLDDDGKDAPSSKKNGKMSVAHMIAPKPAGGRGTKENDDRDGIDINADGGFFFNPQPTSQKVDEDMKREQEAQIAVKPAKRVAAVTSAQPILNDKGKPMLLTVDEAMYQFKKSIPKGAEVEYISTDDSPIIATTKTQSWSDLGITDEQLMENLRAMNCPTPLDVQDKACPPIITGNDVLVGTYTGSGKTLAFLTPLVQRLLWEEPGNDMALLVIAPGRELASQITSVARALIENTGLSVQLAIGGTTFTRNLEQIRRRKPNIIVGTPGRIAELVVGKPGEKAGRLKINALQALVLDEFDALLEYKPHQDPTRAIMHILKRRHGDALQSILCSATASDIIDSVKVKEFLRPGYAEAMADADDVLVTGAKDTTTARVSKTVLHGVVHVGHRRFALDTIRKILHTNPTPQQILIFAEDARKVDIIVEKLAEKGIVAAALHGGMGSEKMDRAEVSKALREGYVGIVVATEMAARGLDAPLLTHVINYDLPTDAPHYAHRAGRCGRGGRPGVVINMTKAPKERNVPKRFAGNLGIKMHSVEVRDGRLVMVDPETQQIDE